MLDKEFFIHICQDGTLTCRHESEPVFNGASLPCYSTDTRERAQQLIILLGVMQYDEHPLLPGQHWYVYPDFTGQVEDIIKIGERFRKFDNETKKPLT